MLLTLLSAVASAECTFHATTSDLDRVLTAAEAAYATLDEVAFEQASTELDFVLPCLVEPVPVDLAARFHRLRGLGRYVDGDPDGARDAFLGARALEPGYVFPEDVLPTGFELRTLYETLPPAGDDHERLPRPSGHGRLWMDGAETRERPSDRGVLFQRLDGAGAAVDTRYLLPTDPTPSYPGVHHRRTVLLGLAGATGAAAGALYGLALASGGSLDRPLPSWDNSDLVAIQHRTNALGGASVGVGVAAVGEVVLAVAWKPR